MQDLTAAVPRMMSITVNTVATSQAQAPALAPIASVKATTRATPGIVLAVTVGTVRLQPSVTVPSQPTTIVRTVVTARVTVNVPAAALDNPVSTTAPATSSTPVPLNEAPTAPTTHPLVPQNVGCVRQEPFATLERTSTPATATVVEKRLPVATVVLGERVAAI